ncbi:MAG: heparinase II/III family protein, partial [Hungatella sp.]
AHHVCPHCKTVYTGEPYDSTWWGQINRRNYTACYDLGLLYLVSQKAAYARKAADIMLEYAKYYKDYEVHGDIPYNGPGKAQAQTLDEAHLIRTFAETYDLIADILSDEEKNRICSQLLVPGMEFLKEHRNNQIHNHEVITDSAIAVVGILLDLKDDIQFALYEPYGLLYQLTHGVTQERMWFEGTFGYHFYALESFFSFEKFAIHTNYSQIHNPIYQEMLELVLNYVHPDDSLPMMNDMNYGHGVLKDQWLYEFAYREIKSNKILKILNKIYENQTRTNIDAFFYGVDFLPEATYHCKNYHTEIGYPGHSVLHGKDGRYLLFKHDTYGGEHDHYDRLAISYLSHGERISPDLGTTGYGAVLHYDYYKNTGIHNCITIDEENQPPQACILKRFETSD